MCVGHDGRMTESQPARGASTRRRRDSARVILLDGDGRVLLFRVVDPRDPKPPLWITPGGGVEPGEALASAAARELEEETGLHLRVTELGDPVAVCRGDWDFRGIPLYGEDWFFAKRVETFEPDDSGWDDVEREFQQGWRWWTPDEMDQTDELVFPAKLSQLARGLHAGEPRSTQPLELPWKKV